MPNWARRFAARRASNPHAAIHDKSRLDPGPPPRRANLAERVARAGEALEAILTGRHVTGRHAAVVFLVRGRARSWTIDRPMTSRGRQAIDRPSKRTGSSRHRAPAG